MASVRFENVAKVYPGGYRAVDNLNLNIEDGEFMVLVGPSGCGKTTALRMMAGLEALSEGEIYVDDRPIAALDPRKRDIAMVFQNYALYPHMSVFENMAFPLRSRGLSKREFAPRVEQVAEMLGLTEMFSRRPKTLSGGQRQRVAMGRAIVREPQAFLMDEPLSNLDAKLRTQMRAEISSLQRQVGVTTLYVTHDQVEAMTMGSRIAVMRAGQFQQEGPPLELYHSPTNLFVASFIGSPAMNLIKAKVVDHDEGLALRLSEQSQVVLPPSAVDAYAQLEGCRGRNVAVGVRPDYLEPCGMGVTDRPTLEGVVSLAEVLGSSQLVHVSVKGQPVLTQEVLEVVSDTDAALRQTLEREAGLGEVAIVARIDGDVSAKIGEVMRLAIAPGRLHFFDIETGISLR